MTVKQVEDFYQALFAFLDDAECTDTTLDTIQKEGEETAKLVATVNRRLEHRAQRELDLDNAARDREIG